MTILFLDQFSDPGGAQQCLLDLLPAIVARGWQAVVAAPGEGWLAERARAAGAKFHSIRCGPFESGRKSVTDALRFLSQQPALTREIARLPADVIYVNGPRLLPVVPEGRPVIFHCHSQLSQPYARWLVRRAIRRTGATVIGACKFVLDPLRSVVNAQVVYNGVAAPRNHRSQATFHIGMLGRIAPQKGQRELLLAARHLPEFRFTICGAPLFGDARYAKEIREEARGLPVEWQDWQADPGALLSTFDLLAVPSTVPEATPRVILEAFAAGVPVLASPCGGIPELIEPNRTGFLIESLAPAQFAAQIRNLAGQPELRAAVAGHAQAAWREHYTLAGYQRRILSIIETAGASARK